MLANGQYAGGDCELVPGNELRRAIAPRVAARQHGLPFKVVAQIVGELPEP